MQNVSRGYVETRCGRSFVCVPAGGREISTKSKLKLELDSPICPQTQNFDRISVVVGAIENLVLIREGDTLRIEDKMLSGWWSHAR